MTGLDILFLTAAIPLGSLAIVGAFAFIYYKILPILFQLCETSPAKRTTSPTRIATLPNRIFKNIKPLLSSYFVSLFCFLFGYGWLNEFKRLGYYTDGRNRVTIHGEQGLVTIYALIIFGYIFLLYSLYITIRHIIAGYKKKKMHNEGIQ